QNFVFSPGKPTTRCGRLSHRVGGGASLSATYHVVLANAVLHQDAAQIFRCRGDTNCVKTAPVINKSGRKKRALLPPEDTTHYASEGVFSLFLLEQVLAAFGDSNPGGKTTLIGSGPILVICHSGIAWHFACFYRI